jgi:hypothetical protein
MSRCKAAAEFCHLNSHLLTALDCICSRLCDLAIAMVLLYLCGCWSRFGTWKMDENGWKWAVTSSLAIPAAMRRVKSLPSKRYDVWIATIWATFSLISYPWPPDYMQPTGSGARHYAKSSKYISHTLCLISLISVNFSNKKTTQAPKAVAHPTSSCPRTSQGQATSRGFLEVSVRSTVSMGAGKPTSATSNAGCNGWLKALEPNWHYKHYLQWYLSVRETALTQVSLSLSEPILLAFNSEFMHLGGSARE